MHTSQEQEYPWLHQSPLHLISHFIRYASVTPDDKGLLTDIKNALTSVGFEGHLLHWHDTKNLYMRWGNKGPHICFAGHVDVVPSGALDLWTFPPFQPTIHEGWLYGRGVADMKGAIGCFLWAFMQFQKKAHAVKEVFPGGSVSLLLTSDEEGPGTHGVRAMVPWLQEQNQIPDLILIGEPTGAHTGSVLQVGRRGSAVFTLDMQGRQGHIAYPEDHDSPIPRMLRCLHDLMNLPLDNGNDVFQPSRLEITSVDVGNPVENMVPHSIGARFGVRFNDMQNFHDLQEKVHTICAHYDAGRCEEAPAYKLQVRHSGDPFVTTHEKWISMFHHAIEHVTGRPPQHTTNGGTTDGRFLHHIAPVLEIGFPDTTIHQINERILVQDIDTLCAIYSNILERFFQMPTTNREGNADGQNIA